MYFNSSYFKIIVKSSLNKENGMEITEKILLRKIDIFLEKYTYGEDIEEHKQYIFQNIIQNSNVTWKGAEKSYIYNIEEMDIEHTKESEFYLFSLKDDKYKNDKLFNIITLWADKKHPLYQLLEATPKKELYKTLDRKANKELFVSQNIDDWVATDIFFNKKISSLFFSNKKTIFYELFIACKKKIDFITKDDSSEVQSYILNKLQDNHYKRLISYNPENNVHIPQKYFYSIRKNPRKQEYISDLIEIWAEENSLIQSLNKELIKENLKIEQENFERQKEKSYIDIKPITLYDYFSKKIETEPHICTLFTEWAKRSAFLNTIIQNLRKSYFLSLKIKGSPLLEITKYIVDDYLSPNKEITDKNENYFLRKEDLENVIQTINSFFKGSETKYLPLLYKYNLDELIKELTGSNKELPLFLSTLLQYKIYSSIPQLTKKIKNNTLTKKEKNYIQYLDCKNKPSQNRVESVEQSYKEIKKILDNSILEIGKELIKFGFLDPKYGESTYIKNINLKAQDKYLYSDSLESIIDEDEDRRIAKRGVSILKEALSTKEIIRLKRYYQDSKNMERKEKNIYLERLAKRGNITVKKFRKDIAKNVYTVTKAFIVGFNTFYEVAFVTDQVYVGSFIRKIYTDKIKKDIPVRKKFVNMILDYNGILFDFFFILQNKRTLKEEREIFNTLLSEKTEINELRKERNETLQR